MLSQIKYWNSDFTPIEKNLNNMKESQCKKLNFSEYNLSENVYNALFHSVLEYIHQLNMLSHVKYRNSNFMWIKKKSKYYLGIPIKKQNCSKYNLSEKIYNALFYYVLEYIHQLHMLSHVKYRNSIFKQIEKNLNIIYEPQCSKQNFSEYYPSEKIYNALFYSVLEYIHQLHMLSHVK